MLRRIKLTLQYDGSAFLGWQSQENGPTVQSAIETAIESITGGHVRVHAAGRTDTGVHALAMPAHFDLEHTIPVERLALALNHFLPEAVSVLSAEEVAPAWDARRSAIMRWYRYQILRARVRQPLGPRAWQVWHPLDLDSMNEALTLLQGDHDFSGFRSSQCQSRRTRLTLEEASLTAAGDLLAIDFKCRSFLHHMVRFMVGTVVAMGLGKIDRDRMLLIRDKGQRPQLIYCAPPEGLCLMQVGYGEDERKEILNAHPTPPSF
ncbi:tRNA pseudouridine(38-40) synthase TruA [bacterium]|nr:tRNA pseudouridine(38-40) synthase TruA [bacterium]